MMQQLSIRVPTTDTICSPELLSRRMRECLRVSVRILAAWDVAEQRRRATANFREASGTSHRHSFKP
jgi:hypothetical protein